MSGRIRLNLSYDGTDFSGWQVQPEARTVQGELEAALARFYGGREVRVVGSGRTDAGVHAVMQVAHYEAPVGREAGEILRGVNALLPSGVHIWGARAVEEAFHARFRAVQRTYAYRLLWAPSPFADRYGWHVPYAIDSERAVEASRIMIGTHDFSTFATRPDPDENPVCELRRIEWRAREDGAVLLVQADRFLRRMVRTLVGTLAEVGAGRRDPRSLEDLLAGREGRAGVPAPPQGLALLRVEYGDDEAGDEPPPSPWRMEA